MCGTLRRGLAYTMQVLKFVAVLLGALSLAAGLATANIVQATALSTNSTGQVNATFQTGNSFFDVFVDILDADGNSRCQPTDPCFPVNSAGPSLKSGELDTGPFQVL